jgi:transglutaminase-like putative cysteine protease
MAHREATFRVVARESIRVNQATYVAYRLEAELWGQRMSFWLDEHGTTLKEEGFLGLTAVKSSAANAPRGLEEGGNAGVDLYELAAITPDRPLPKPMRTNYLKVRLAGITESDLSPADLNSTRQIFLDGVIEVTREALPSRPDDLSPIGPADEVLSPFLQPAFNIESDEEEIISKAREITGEERRPLAICRKLLDWVYHHLEKRPVASIPSAIEVLRTRMGDCNEHATLLTAFLRAMGVPARLSSGLVYTRGKFFYHAWTEAYVGGWVTLDATMNQLPVDATHITLVQGDLEKQVEITGLIGKLGVEILEYRYD